jgi:predicted DNA-binding protein (UPF0251 family)
MHCCRHRRRYCRRGRIPKPITIAQLPTSTEWKPSAHTNAEPVHIDPAEIEALRLVDLEELSQKEAGEKMGVSRGTVWRLVQSARKKTAQALSEGRPLFITAPISEEEA